MERLTVSGTHAEIGFSIGRHFSDEIHRGLEENRVLRNRYIPFHRSPAGLHVFNELLALHTLEILKTHDDRQDHRIHLENHKNQHKRCQEYKRGEFSTVKQ